MKRNTTNTQDAPKAHRELLKSEPSFVFERIAKFKPHAVITYGKFTSSMTKPTQTNTNSLSNLEKPNEEGYNGYMSDATRRNVKGILENLLTAIELNTTMKFPFVRGQEKPLDVVYPTFVTLTLPAKQMHCDNDVKRDIFTPFMQEIIRKWNVKCYVWVAETQKNGNLHFHVLMDRGIPALRLRQIWNKHLNQMPYEYVNCYSRIQKYIYRCGFVFRDEMWEKRLEKERARAKAEGRRLNAKEIKGIKEKETARQKEAYKKGVENDWKDPNSTDIHAIQNIKKLTAYICKYFTKAPVLVAPVIHKDQKVTTNKSNGRLTIEFPDSQGELMKWEVVKEGGKYYLETIRVQNDPIWGTSEIPERVEFQPQFENRKLRGRMWGASEILKAPDTKPTPFTIAVKTYTEAWNTYQVTTTRLQTFKVPTGVVDIFGNVEYTYEDRPIEHKYNEMLEKKWFTDNKSADAYLKILEAQVPAEDIKAATAKAGALFASQESNKVIPLREPQKDYLKQHSPPLWEGYQYHYQTIFKTLYDTAADEAAAA